MKARHTTPQQFYTLRSNVVLDHCPRGGCEKKRDIIKIEKNDKQHWLLM
jgi:hypothetical protein